MKTRDVSVIVITYNQDLKKLIQTLDSLLIQEKIDFEIIICDDGSKERNEYHLRNYFSLRNFSDYTLIIHDQNGGTVSNYYSGLKIAKGEYSKLISPGDCLTDKYTLFNWICYLKRCKAKWSFSDAYYYHSDHGKVDCFRTLATPQIIRPYLEKNRIQCIWNYIALEDIANGAAIIGETRTQLHFCKMIKDRGIKYSEDSIYRLMMFYGIVGCYFPEVAIFYEYGTGISSLGNPVWRERLAIDKKKMIQILLEEKDKTKQQKRMVVAMIRNSQPRKIKRLLTRGKVFFWLKWHFHPRYTPIPGEAIVLEEKR